MSSSRPLETAEIQELAADFHDTYEYLAPSFGYHTREQSRVAWSDLPTNLQNLMVATVEAVVNRLLHYRENETEAE